MTSLLPDDLAHRVRTAANLLCDLARGRPNAPSTLFGLVASIGTGAPEVVFPADDVIAAGFLAGELAGLASGLGMQLPLMLVSAGIDEALAADAEAMANAIAIARSDPPTIGATDRVAE